MERIPESGKDSALTPPFAWVGGKRKLAAEIIKRMPEHRLYVEVFGGALAVLCAKPRSKIEVVNDINGDLINLHRTIRDRPESLRGYLETLWASRELFYLLLSKKVRPRNDIERAAFYYYMLSVSFGSKGSTFAMPKSRPPKNLTRDFSQWSQRLQRVCIEQMDFEKLIREYDRPYTLFYCDPPYVGTERYYQGVDGFDHEKLRDILMEIKGSFVLSYNDCDQVREWYRGCQIEKVETVYSLNGSNQKKAGEVIIRK